MTEATKAYSKARREFGKPVFFEDSDPKIQINIPPQPHKLNPARDEDQLFVERDPVKILLHNIPKMTEHSVSANLN